ncbi:hypothetical protein AKO1_009498 [Acrasis kona]|uniref:Uncharacterized protein n=1 Tax=Acrasis kona TaxID=1008807 RepID=A0AAW2ZMR2_9EUKA
MGHLRDMNSKINQLQKYRDVVVPSKRRILALLSGAAYFYLVLQIIKYMRKRYKFVVKNIPMMASYYDQVAMISSAQYTLVEPVLATAMMTAFSVIYRQVRTNTAQRLQNTEQDLLVQNSVSGVMNAFIRNDGVVPDDAVLAAMKQINSYIKTNCHKIDQYTKMLEVSCHHPRTGEMVEARCLIPVHDTKFDTFDIEFLNESEAKIQ